MDIRTFDQPKHANVSLKHARSSVYLQVTDDKKVVARNDPKAPFKEICVIGGDMVDGKSETLVAFQVEDNYFLAPKKPKDIHKDTTLKIRPKKIEYSKIYDKKDSEIEGTSRKYWFRLQYVDKSNFLVYESLAYKGFYLSVEGNNVLMRKCNKITPNDENYHIHPMPWPGQKKNDKSQHTEGYDASATTSGEGEGETTYLRTEDSVGTVVTSGIVDKHIEVEVTRDVIFKDDAVVESMNQTKAERKEIIAEESSEGMTVTSQMSIAVTDTVIYLEVNMENITAGFKTGSETVPTETEVERDEIIEEEIQITQIKADAVNSQIGGIPLAPDVTASCEADDKREDMEATSERNDGGAERSSLW